jgi:uncharacterized protein YbaR (Trm112 family)
MQKPAIAASLHALSGHHVRGDLVCTQCGRLAGVAEAVNDRPGTPMTIRVQDPSHADAARRLTCPHCTGRLWLQNRENVRNEWHALDSEALRSQVGRRAKPPGPV